MDSNGGAFIRRHYFVVAFWYEHECRRMPYASDFASADSDSSGGISAAEMAAFTGTYGGRGDFIAIDSDSSGIVSASEFNRYTGSIASAAVRFTRDQC